MECAQKQNTLWIRADTVMTMSKRTVGKQCSLLEFGLAEIFFRECRRELQESGVVESYIFNECGELPVAELLT